MSGARDVWRYDGNTLVVEINKNECCFGDTIQTNFEYVYVSGCEIVKYVLEDKIVD